MQHPKIVVHIGPHKTGTTAIQKWLAENREALEERGVRYPRLWQDTMWGHHDLVSAVQSTLDGSIAAAKIAWQIDGLCEGTTALVFSSENFANLTPEQIARLHCLLGNRSVEIVYFARRWSGLLPSTWQENVKHGYAATFPEYALEHLANPRFSETLNYANVVSRYVDVFGMDSVRVVSYEALRDARTDLATYFTNELVGIPTPQVAPGEVINTSLVPEDVEIVRVLNDAAQRREPDAIIGMAPRLFFTDEVAASSPHVEALRRRLRSHIREFRFADHCDVFLRVQADFIQRFGACIVNGAEDRLFDRRMSDACVYVTGDYWMDPSVVAHARALVEQMFASTPAA